MRKSIWTVAMFVVLVATLTACPGDAADDRPVGGEPGAAAGGTVTAADIREHRLTMDQIRSWFAAYENLATLAGQDPTVGAALEGEGDGDPASMLARVEANPRIAQAIRDAGLSPREYVLTGMAFMQASFAQALLDQNPEAQLPPEVNPQNVELVRANRAEIERLSTELGARRPDQREDDLEDDDAWEDQEEG